jgi:UDP-N-acetylmuramyl pentapeptide phosphotransferase/UDP-N-acetylglucosamine-1-phosphate transferase
LIFTKHINKIKVIDTYERIQKIHIEITSRTGGIGIFVGVISGCYFSQTELFGELLWTLLISSVPVFFIGLVEDLTQKTGIFIRILVTMSSGLLGYALTSYSISDLNFYVLDWLMEITWISVVFTIFAIAGITNAFNIIDGLNGLSSGTVLIISGSFAFISFNFGDIQLAYVCLLIFSSTLGFFILNWPFGYLFLGDGGAYFLGFGIAWIAVLLMERMPQISAWAPLLVCSYPFIEVIVSMIRRRKRNKKIGHPDRLHMHSLVFRRVTRKLFPNASNLFKNSIAGIMVLPINIPPIWMAINFPTETPVLILSICIFYIFYCSIYLRLTQFKWCISARQL